MRLFQPGAFVATPGAVEVFKQHAIDPFDLLNRHLSGDWGDVCQEDRLANDDAVKEGNRVLSSYVVAPGTKLWLITEWDRSYTTVLLPDEY